MSLAVVWQSVSLTRDHRTRGEHHDRFLHGANCPAPARASCLRPGHLQARLAAMTSGMNSSPEDEYAADEYADHDAEDREQPSTPAEIPDDEPEEDVLEQRQEIPYRAAA